MDIIAVNKFRLKKRYLFLFIILVLIIKHNLTKNLWMKDENIRDVSSQTKEYAKEKGAQAKEAVSNGLGSLKDTFKQKSVSQTQGAN
jgi:hypothetical protein